jgi:transmembrane sensor
MRFDTPKTTKQQAIYWFILLESPECTPKQRERFEEWLNQSIDNQDAFAKVERSSAFVDRHLADPVFTQISQQALEQAALDSDRLFQDNEDKNNQSKSCKDKSVKDKSSKSTKVQALAAKQPSQTRWLKLSAAAAVLFILLGSVFFITQPFQSSQRVLQQASNKQIYQTAIGERSTVTLADGSSITLNTNSRVEVHLSSVRRSIKLVKGQGFFDVAKDINRPFMVDVGNKRVVALGTAFDVKLDESQKVEVILVEGRVAVDDISNKAEPAIQDLKQQSTKKYLPATNSQIVELAPGERFVADKQKQAEVISLASAEEATSWREGRLIYRGESIQNVIREMNRYSTKKIKLNNDSRISNIKISGVFKTGNNAYFIDKLTRTHPLGVRQTGLNQITLVWREF